LHVIRDILKLTDNYREAKKLIGLGNFKVDGKIVRDGGYPLGLMDVLSIEKMNSYYRVLPDSHHGLILHEISEEESTFKLCRISNKTTIKGGHIQLNLHDGRNITIKVNDPRNPKEDIYKRMDVLKISIPEQEIIKLLNFKKNNLAIIMSGKNIGQIGKIVNILKRFGPKASTVSIQHNGSHTETLYDYTFIVGEDQSEVDIPLMDN
jgi:small subunit ribosomal protein S4e